MLGARGSAGCSGGRSPDQQEAQLLCRSWSDATLRFSGALLGVWEDKRRNEDGAQPGEALEGLTGLPRCG